MNKCAVSAALRQYEANQDRADSEALIIERMARDILVDELEPEFQCIFDDIEELQKRWEYKTHFWQHTAKDLADDFLVTVKKELVKEAALEAAKRFDENQEN